MSEGTTLTLHRAQQYLITALVTFSTFMLADMYKDWKAHLREDAQIKVMVYENKEAISRNTSTINYLTGRVNVISDRIGGVELRQSY